MGVGVGIHREPDDGVAHEVLCDFGMDARAGLMGAEGMPERVKIGDSAHGSRLTAQGLRLTAQGPRLKDRAVP